MPYAIVFFASLFTAVWLTPAARWLSIRWGLVAQPGGRRRHQGAIPQLGGLPLAGALLVGSLLALWLLPPGQPDSGLLRGVLLGSLIVFLGGLLDDCWELPPWALFGVQLAGTAVAMGHEVFIERFRSPLTGEEVAIPWFWLIFLLTLFWIVGMTNTVNFLDGLDGLAAGVGAIAALLFAWHSYTLQQTTVAAFMLALAGALLGFLPFNFAPARIFLGSAGAYLLGYQLATLSIIAPAKIATALLVMAVPILDVAWQIFDRLRRGQSPLRGDRGHLHFRLSDGGLPTWQIVLGYYGVALAFGLVAILIPSPLWKLILLLVLATAVLALLAWFSYRWQTPDPGTKS